MKAFKKQPRRNADEMYKVIETWKASGQKQQDFCAKRGLPFEVFKYWLKQWRLQQERKSRHSMPEGPGAQPILVIEYPNGVKIHLPCNCDVNFLVELIRTVK